MSQVEIHKKTPSDLESLFQLSKIQEYVAGHPKDRIALQVDPELLPQASKLIQQINHPQCFICADSTYGNCCCDLITAEKYQASILIHLGNRACLQNLHPFPKHTHVKEVIHFFGDKSVNAGKCVKGIKEFEKDDRVTLIMYDLEYMESVQKDLVPLLKESIEKGKVIVTDVSQRKYQKRDAEPKETSNLFINGYDMGIEKLQTEKHQFFYIGQNSTQLTQLILEYGQDYDWIRYSPETDKSDQLNSFYSSSYRELRKRFVLSEKAKEAEVIGIVVATVTVRQYMSMISYVQKIIEKAGKKSYLFYVGKLNVPKLANFNEIDMFCLISCNQCCLIDSKEYYKPIITPFELKCALDDEWTGGFSTKFLDIIQKVEMPQSQQDKEPINYQLQTINEQEYQVQILKDSPAIAHLHERGWKGLDLQHDKEVQDEIKEGQKGIAQGYSAETTF